jgi:hypothetical protein
MMKMDFARRNGLGRTSRLILILTVGIGGSAHSLWQRHHLLQHRAALTPKIEASASESNIVAVPDPATVRAMERIVADLRSPWEEALEALERASRPDIVVTRLESEGRSARLRVLGRANSSDAFLDFVQRLRDDTFWRRVDPVSESAQEEGASSIQPIAFQMVLEGTQP